MLALVKAGVVGRAGSSERFRVGRLLRLEPSLYKSVQPPAVLVFPLYAQRTYPGLRDQSPIILPP